MRGLRRTTAAMPRPLSLFSRACSRPRRNPRFPSSRPFPSLQCVQAGKIGGKLGTNPQYHAGILLKANLKLGGVNLVSPASKGGLALLREKPTIVFGVDVNHPPPGSAKPSFSALVASMDPECARYYSVVGAQAARKELVDLKDKVRTCLRKYHEKNRGVAPQRIIFFRDGARDDDSNTASPPTAAPSAQVNHPRGARLRSLLSGSIARRTPFALPAGVANNQFANECKEEIASIRRAFEEAASMRARAPLPRRAAAHAHARRRRPAHGQCRAGGRATCRAALSSTRTWCRGHPTAWPRNFYFVGQYGLKGTCRPTHYHVLANDIANASLQDVERLGGDLCFLYARATKVVSRPAPVSTPTARHSWRSTMCAHMHTAHMHTSACTPPSLLPSPRPHPALTPAAPIELTMICARRSSCVLALRVRRRPHLPSARSPHPPTPRSPLQARDRRARETGSTTSTAGASVSDDGRVDSAGVGRGPLDGSAGRDVLGDAAGGGPQSLHPAMPTSVGQGGGVSAWAARGNDQRSRAPSGP